MKTGLLKEAIVKYISGVLLVGLLLFVPAGTFRWNNGLLFMGLLFIPMFAAGLVMYAKAPELLKSRLNAKEKRGEQKGLIAYSGLMFIAAFVIAGLGKRLGWRSLPQWAVACGSVIFLLSYLMFAEVLRENSYLSRTIEVREGQKVVDTGLYGIVRHPMYSATLTLFLSMPLILGSPISFAVMLSYIPMIVLRIKDEEKFLEQELSGYDEYEKKVRYRLLPLIW
jgi:protein-S-isoprenylcysteine O-methyltransferase Ste14